MNAVAEKAVKDDISKLVQQRDQLKIDIENMRTLINHETEKKILDARKIAAEAEESRKKLGSDRKELEAMAGQIKADRELLSKERRGAYDMKENFQKAYARVNEFVTLVRRESEKL